MDTKGAAPGPALFDLGGRVAMVTGASRGLGRSIALGLAGCGARVALVARDREALARVTGEIGAAGGEALPIAADLRDVPGLPAIVEQAIERWGRLDVLVNNAGVGTPTLAVDMDEAEWDLVLGTNLKSVFFLSRAAARAMLRLAADRGDGEGEIRGRIVNISSMMGTVGGNRRSAYCASKGGLDALTRALAVEWARHPVLVNAVAPGYVETDMTDALQRLPKYDRWIRDRTPLGRWARPDDLVGAVIFLSAPASDYVTGSVLRVDGGWVANA